MESILHHTQLLNTVLYLGLAVLGAVIILPQTKARFKLYYESNEKNKKRIDKCPSIKKGYFFPTFYLANGILQAAFGNKSKHHDPNIKFDHEILHLSCGGKVALHWASHKEESDELKAKLKNVTIIMLPGLTASSKDPYMRNISSEALNNGYKVVIYHPRGNQVEMILPKNGYVDVIEDFKFATEYIQKKHPNDTFFAVGHSYGANTLINYLGRYRDSHPFKVAASVSNPFDFHKAGTDINNTMFDKWLAQIMQKWAKTHEEPFKNAPEHYTMEYEKALSAKSFWEFDEYITRRMMGFNTVDEYYEGISSARALKYINIPLLCLHSKDDPILHHSSIPIEECKHNKNIILVVTNNGGHVGWFHGLWRPKRWYPKPTVEFLNCCYEELTQAKK